jgi:hypothetical protein
MSPPAAPEYSLYCRYVEEISADLMVAEDKCGGNKEKCHGRDTKTILDKIPL